MIRYMTLITLSFLSMTVITKAMPEETGVKKQSTKLKKESKKWKIKALDSGDGLPSSPKDRAFNIGHNKKMFVPTLGTITEED